MSGDKEKTVVINHGTKLWKCEAIQPFAKQRFGYLGQTFENEVRTAFSATKNRIVCFVNVAYIPKRFNSKNISSQSVFKLL